MIAVIMLVASVAYRDARDALAIERQRQALLDETRRAADEVTDLAQAANAILPTFTSPEPRVYQTDGATVILSLPAYDTGGARLLGLTDTVVVGLEPGAGQTLMIRTFPAVGSRRATGTKRLTDRLANLAFHYFAPDGTDADLADEEITDPALFSVASRFEARLATDETVEGIDLRIDLVGGGVLRNR